MAQEKTLTELIDSYTWYDKKNKAQEIFRRLQAGLGGQITTQEDGVNVNENTTLLNFTGGGVNLTDLGEGSVEINIESSGSSPQDLQSVTDIGNVTTNSIFSVSDTPISAVLAQNVNGAKAYIRADGSEGVLSLNNVTTGKQVLLKINNTNPPILFNPTTTYLPFSNNLTLVSQITDGTTIVTADDEGKVDLSTLSLGGGDYIPLSGTEVGSPVTGGIVSEASIEATSFIVPSYDVNNVVEIIDDDGTGLISVKETDTNYGTSIYPDGLSNNVNGTTKLFYRAMDDLSWRIQSSMPSFRGLDSNTYYGANYTDNTYVQKKYVDDNFLQGLEIYSESGTLGGGDGKALIGNFDIMSNPSGVGLYFNQNIGGGQDALIINNTNLGLQQLHPTNPFAIGATSEKVAFVDNSSMGTQGIVFDFSSTSAIRELTVQDSSGTLALTSDLDSLLPIATADTGTVISLITSGGNLCNFGSTNANTTYTTTGTVLNAYAKVLINTTSEPTITGATKIAGATWVTGTDMYMVVNYTGAARGVEYYFLEI